MEQTGIWLMATLYILAGISHFIWPAMYKAIMPPNIPKPALMVQISGLAEMVFGMGLLFDSTRIYAAWGLIVLLLAVFPANIYMATSGRFRKIPSWILYLRLPLQLILIWWAWTYT